MKFKSTPNLYVRIANKYIQRATGKKGFYFDDKGEYETENSTLIKVLSQSFEIITEKIKVVDEIKSEEIKTFKCKKCDYETSNKGELLVHYREHKKEE